MGTYELQCSNYSRSNGDSNSDCAGGMFVTHESWTATPVPGAGGYWINITGLIPFSVYCFTLSGDSLSTNFSFWTDEDEPTGFGEDKISVNQSFTAMTVSWLRPDMLNGRLQAVNITLTVNPSRKKRTTGSSSGRVMTSNEESGDVTFRDLCIATKYRISVEVINR